MLKKIFLGLTNVNRRYVSPADQLIANFDKSHTLSASQEAEKARCEAVRFLRDHPEKIKSNMSNIQKFLTNEE